MYILMVFIFSSYRGSPGEVKSIEENPMDQGKVGVSHWYVGAILLQPECFKLNNLPRVMMHTKLWFC